MNAKGHTTRAPLNFATHASLLSAHIDTTWLSIPSGLTVVHWTPAIQRLSLTQRDHTKARATSRAPAIHASTFFAKGGRECFAWVVSTLLRFPDLPNPRTETRLLPAVLPTEPPQPSCLEHVAAGAVQVELPPGIARRVCIYLFISSGCAEGPFVGKPVTRPLPYTTER